MLTLLTLALPQQCSLSTVQNSTPTTVHTEIAQETWIPREQTVNGLDVVYVPEGCFLMGSDQGEADEQPVHEVCLNAFWIGRTEITNDEYAACVENGACSPPHNVTYFEDSAYADHPVVYVDWNQANTYAQSVGCYLPAEAQWEYAARGPESLRFPWGNEFDGSRLNHCDTNCRYNWRKRDYDDGYAEAAPVGRFPEGMSWVGALDMMGNVWEWVSDWYTPDYYAKITGAAIDPTGPDTGWGRVVRGGSWASHMKYTRAASRDWDSAHLRFLVVGFRIACSGETPAWQR